MRFVVAGVIGALAGCGGPEELMQQHLEAMAGVEAMREEADVRLDVLGRERIVVEKPLAEGRSIELRSPEELRTWISEYAGPREGAFVAFHGLERAEREELLSVVGKAGFRRVAFRDTRP